MTAKDLYERDFFEWTQCNAALLRASRFDQADIEHIAEEIEDMGRSQRHELGNRLRILLAHLLKWRLKAHVTEILPDIYRPAVEQAISESELPDDSFPTACPFSIGEILNEEFFPE